MHYRDCDINKNFQRETKADIVIEKVNISRATYKEAGEFRDFIKSDVNSGWNKFVIDMEPCEFLDSTFLGVFIEIFRQVEISGGNLKLASVHENVKLILDITRISEIFTIYPDTETALKSFY